MINRSARAELAELLMKFRNSEIDGNTLLRSWPRSEDAAIRGIGIEFGTLLGQSHISHNEKLGEMKVTDMRDRKFMETRLDRTILFLRAGQEYKWRDGDPSLPPFQILALLISLPLMLVVVSNVEDKVPFAMTCAVILMVLVVTVATLAGGSGLRSLFTGIDHGVWPFYRRQHYHRAMTQLED